MADDDIDRVQELLQQGLDQGRLHHYVEACATMRAVLAELDEFAPTPRVAEIAVQAELTLAYSSMESGDSVAGALAGVDRAQDWVDRLAPDDLAVTVAQVRGYCHARSGDAAAALAAWEVDDTAWHRGDPTTKARLLLNRGNLHMEMGDLTRAWEDLRRAEELADRAGDVELAHKARHNRGYLAHLRGDLPAALRLMGTASHPPIDDTMVAQLLADPIVAMDRARALVEAGLFDEADALLLDAIAGFAGGDRWQDQGEAELARARLALLTGDLDVAARAARRAHGCFERQGNRRWGERAEIVELAVEVERHVRVEVPPTTLESVRGRVDQVLARIAPGTDDGLESVARLMAVELSLAAGDLDRARIELEAARPAATAGTSMRLRWHRARARVAARSGRPAREVRDLVVVGMRELATQQARLGSLDLRTAVAVHGHELASIGIRSAMDGGDGRDLYEVVEQSKAASTRVAAVRADMPVAHREVLGQLRMATTALDHLDPDAHPEEAARVRDEMAGLMEHLRTLEWERDGVADVATIASLDDVAVGLADHGATALSYVALGDEVHVVRIRDGDADVVALAPRQQIDALGARARADLQAMMAPGLPPAIRDVMHQSLRTGLHALDRLLVTPVAVGDVPLVVVPQGGLSVLPWPLLPSRLGIETTLTPCLSRWLSALQVRGDRDEPVTLVAGPGLLRAEDEVGALAASWPGARHLVGADATVAATTTALDRAPLVHVAAHGHHRESSPLFSSMRMADGPVFAHELAKGSGAEVVVLSACELGAATVRTGDEPLGFTAALLDADVGTVVAGVTRVRDDVAHDVMCDMHRDLAAGASPARALAEAVADAWETGAVAPFTCVGAGLRPLSIVERVEAAGKGAPVASRG